MPSGIEFRVHPLVLLNLSDHYTRCAVSDRELVASPQFGPSSATLRA